MRGVEGRAVIVFGSRSTCKVKGATCLTAIKFETVTRKVAIWMRSQERRVTKYQAFAVSNFFLVLGILGVLSRVCKNNVK